MSTDQIYNEHGQIKYDDGYVSLPDGFDICERCGKNTEIKECVYFKSRKLVYIQQQKHAACVCNECWEKYYEFYSMDYIICRTKGSSRKFIPVRIKYPHYRIGEIVSINDQHYIGQGTILRQRESTCEIRTLSGIELRVHKNNITKI